MPPRKTSANKSVPIAEIPLEDEPFEEGDDQNAEDLATQISVTEPVEDQAGLAEEPLFSQLFKRAVDSQDAVLRDYAAHVVPRISSLLAHVTAKGGNFVQQKLSDGLSAEEVARYAHDQSMRAHLINGLLPTAQVARTLRRWGVIRFVDEFDETTYRLFCAGYTLHDWLKLPGAADTLAQAGLTHGTVNVAQNLAVVETIIRDWCVTLGLDAFLAPIGSLEHYLHDLILIASNTQLKWGTMHNLSALPGLHARRRSTLLATDLATLADYLAYLGRTPLDAAQHPSIRRVLESFSDGRIRVTLTYHHLADVRGVLTNIINNAAVELYAKADLREPLLYAPTGVVYLTRDEAPPAPAIDTVADAVIARIRERCRRQLELNLTGFLRSGKGLKYADYYELFFDARQLALLVARAATNRIVKDPIAGKRYANIAAKRMAPDGLDLDLPIAIEVDRVAETCALLVKVAAQAAPDLDAEGWLLAQLGVSDLRPTVQSINSNKTAGGVPYGWYYAAGVCRKQTPGREPQEWIDQLNRLAAGLAAQFPETPSDESGSWADLRRYVADHLRFAQTDSPALTTRLAAELARYSHARKVGRGATNLCSLCSSSYTINEQQEAAILFAPMVYTNKQPLHGSKAIRHICAACAIEMMLRQLLMKRGRESGKNFEGRRVRYLFFYPTYFFTPETLRMMRAVQDRLRRVGFTTLRRTLQPAPDADTQELRVTPAVFQQLQELMLSAEELVPVEEDRLFRLRYEEREPITFSFVGIPPAARDAKDAEAWVHPAFLGLLLPLLLDIKVVASESMLPIVQEATELAETVAFDGAHAFVRYLIPQARLNLDQLLPALQRLTAAYIVHMDGNAKVGSGGFDYRWHELPAVARNLATSPLYAFFYLKKGLRREGHDLLPAHKAALYRHMVEHYLDQGENAMSHARELTLLYRRFYRHKRGRRTANAILRPISEAAATLLDADLQLFDSDDALIEVVRGRLEKFIENVGKGNADGSIPVWIAPAERQQALETFCHYFVETIYRDVFGRNRAALAGKQLNLLKNACEAIYLAEQRREWQERGEAQEESADETEQA